MFPLKKGLAGGLAVVLVAGVIGGNYAWRNYSTTIKAFLGIEKQGVELSNVDEETKNEVQTAAKENIEDIEEEGAVLMQNNDGVLPLKNTKVNIFGIRAYDSFYTGGGSSGCKHDDDVTLQDALTEEGFEYNTSLKNSVWPFSNFTKAILAGTDCLLSTESQDDMVISTIST